MLYSWITANRKYLDADLPGTALTSTDGGHSKKITMNAIVLMSFCLGNIIGPETFQEKDAPQYIPAKMTIVIILSFAILFTVLLDLAYIWENRKRDREGHQDLPPNFEFLDLTDKENRNFRYVR